MAQYIRNLKQYGSCGYDWEENELTSWGHYRTDGIGDGLWKEIRGEWKQIAGTTQFTLPTNRKSAYNKLLREWKKSRSFLVHGAIHEGR